MESFAVVKALAKASSAPATIGPHIARSGLALNMKLLLKILVIGGLLGLVAWGMLYISSEENSIHLNGDWGIAKDKPVR